MAAVLVQGLTPSTEVSAALLLGLAAAGYAGTDFIEGFAQTLAGTKPPGGKTTTTSTDNATSGPLEGKPSTEEAVAAAVGGGFTGQLHEAKKYKTDIDAAAAEYKLAPELDLCRRLTRIGLGTDAQAERPVRHRRLGKTQRKTAA